MGDLLRTLGDLVLGSVPTMIIFLVLLFAYRFLLYGPLMRTRAARRERTAGAVEKAHAAIATADAKSQEYEAKLRTARSEIFHRREQKVQQWNAERENALASARLATHERVQVAQAALAAQAVEARREIESSVDKLAAQVLEAVLPSNLARAGGGR
jgi:F-type H+-transporting ATPase subunit b